MPPGSQEEFLKRQLPAVIALLDAARVLDDLMREGQISRNGVAVVCHLTSLQALLERYTEGTATLIFVQGWDVQP